jgi:hypothetical protein
MSHNASIADEHNGRIAIPLSAGNFQPRVSNGCADVAKAETTLGRPDILHLAFDGTTAEYAQWGIPIPDRYDGGTFTFVPHWTGLVAGAGTVIWRMAAVCIPDDGTIDVVFGTAISCSAKTFTVAEDLHISAESAAITPGGTASPGNWIVFELSRDPATDTRTQDANFMGGFIYMTANAMNDD